MRLPGWLENLRRKRAQAADPRTQLRAMREGLALRPEEIDTSKIVPIFVPASFFSLGNWPGPSVSLRAREIGLTWTVMLPGQAMRYVDFAMAKHWDGLGIDWKALALGNLAEHSGDKLGSHQLRRANGDVYGVGFMYPDGLGPSRLLLRERLADFFPGGYQVALPEMSCGFAFAAGLDGTETATVRDLVENCFRNGTRPLASGIYEPEDLLPEPEAS